MDQVGFPVRGAIVEIGGIESGFFIGVVGIVLAEIIEGGIGREEWNALRQEAGLVKGSLHQDRGDMIADVIANGFGAGKHQLRLSLHVGLRIVEQVGAGQFRDDEPTNAEDDEQDQVEFRQQLHGIPSFRANENGPRQAELSHRCSIEERDYAALSRAEHDAVIA